ncbi:hypothetical protein BKA66DRAFT_448036 [Pyrenochaeta sp. MPI-SDFR-AT-0127]|nr:hypothetical protein BKA66DRAFT_448036 [Pyrenochaeta sp. MPI-SDFR-AT-0127]
MQATAPILEDLLLIIQDEENPRDRPQFDFNMPANSTLFQNLSLSSTFANLRSMRLEHVHVNVQDILSVAALPRIQDIHVSECVIEEPWGLVVLGLHNVNFTGSMVLQACINRCVIFEGVRWLLTYLEEAKDERLVDVRVNWSYRVSGPKYDTDNYA